MLTKICNPMEIPINAPLKTTTQPNEGTDLVINHERTSNNIAAKGITTATLFT